jgi:general stress protein YciG
MNPEEQRKIASKGGKAAHRKGVAHEWNSEEAAAAGEKGGKAHHVRYKRNSSKEILGMDKNNQGER